MKKFRIRNDILFTIDAKRVSVVDTKSKSHIFIDYPEAAVWSVLINNYGVRKSTQMLASILDKNSTDTGVFIRLCMNKWKQLNIID